MVTVRDEPFRVLLDDVTGPELPGYRWKRESRSELLVDGPWSYDTTTNFREAYTLSFLIVVLPCLGFLALLGLIANGLAQLALVDLVTTGAWIVYLRRRPELTWRRWRLERGGVFREGVQLLGGRLPARHYPNVIDFEISHAVEKRWFSRGEAGSRHGTDVLWFRPAPASEPVLVAVRKFHAVGQSDEIAKQIDPSILRLGGLMAREVGVPLYGVATGS
jgi:hypothetical protein